MAKPQPKRPHLSYEENVCHSYACAIQTCLKRHNYNEKKCEKAIEDWRRCLETAKIGNEESQKPASTS